MAQPTTTLALVINDWTTRITNIAPAMLADRAFNRCERNRDLRAWAESGAGEGILRRFEIVRTGVRDEPGVIAAEQRLERDLEILVAYPVLPGLYGTEQLEDFGDVTDSDGHQIVSLLSNADYWLSGVNLQLPTVGETDRGGPVWFLPVIVRVQWFGAR